jgi:glycosyltransferase involved in cell wall biosynthesis
MTPRILMLCNNFRKDDASRYLTNDLADALVAAGAEVKVGVIDWYTGTGKEPELVPMSSGVEALFVAPRALTGLGGTIASATKWLGASAFLARALKKTWGRRQFDLIISFSPLVTNGMSILWAKRRYRCRAIAYITDFFPLHQAAAGQIRGRGKVAIGRALETMLMHRFETIACMSPAGIAYLRNHYRLKSGQTTPVLRLWAEIDPLPPVDRAIVRGRHGLPLDRSIILFGGQIAEGRGIEDLLDMARLARCQRPDLLFLLIGEGRLEPLVRAYVHNGGDNVRLHPPVPRDSYLEIAAACDLGLVATLGDTGVPTFPSKTIDYLRVGLPIAASIEATTDYGDFVEENGFGTAVIAGKVQIWLDAVTHILDSPETHAAMVSAGRRALLAHFDVAQAAQLVLREGLGLDASGSRQA